jgi:hypothetical protein
MISKLVVLLSVWVDESAYPLIHPPLAVPLAWALAHKQTPGSSSVYLPQICRNSNTVSYANRLAFETK